MGRNRRKQRSFSNKPSGTKFQQHGRKNKTKKHDLTADEWTRAQQELDQQLREMDLYCKEITGDGNCLFRSLSDQFYGNTRQHSKIRKEVCAYLETNRDHFQFFVEDDKTLDYHLARMKKDGTYGGNMELVGFAQLHRVDIKIYQPGTIYVIKGNENDSSDDDDVSTKNVETRRTLHIAYHNWEHYSSVRNIQGPHEGDPKITSEPINITNDSGSDNDCPPNSIEKMIMNSTGERNLAKIREMMKRLKFDHDEVINELIERSQITSINDDGSNSRKVIEEDINSQEKNLPTSQNNIDKTPSVISLSSSQNGNTTQSKMLPKKRSQEKDLTDFTDSVLKSQPLSKKDKRKLRKKQKNPDVGTATDKNQPFPKKENSKLKKDNKNNNYKNDNVARRDDKTIII